MTAPAVEVIDLADLKPCPPSDGPWPARASLPCACCDVAFTVHVELRVLKVDLGVAEVAVDLTNDRERAHLIFAAAAGAGWLLIGDGSADPKPSWVCPDCQEVAVDFEAPEVRDAVERRARHSRIIVEERAAAPAAHGSRLAGAQVSDRKRPRRRRSGHHGPQPRIGRGPVLAGRDVEEIARGCARKQGYPSQVEARRVADKCEAQRGVPLHVYACDVCGLWHLTSVRRWAS